MGLFQKATLAEGVANAKIESLECERAPQRGCPFSIRLADTRIHANELPLALGIKFGE
jgi:hypothetical protein